MSAYSLMCFEVVLGKLKCWSDGFKDISSAGQGQRWMAAVMARCCVVGFVWDEKRRANASKVGR
jgi:hypothetical protein